MDTGFGIKGLVMKGDEILVLRKPNGDLDLPGGRVEEWESPEESLEREIFEELGRVRVRFLASMARWSFSKKSGLLVKGETWGCGYQGGSIRLSGEHTGFIWIKESQLRSLNLFSRFGLEKFEFWTNPGSRIKEEHGVDFRDFHLKGVEKFVLENRSRVLR